MVAILLSRLHSIQPLYPSPASFSSTTTPSCRLSPSHLAMQSVSSSFSTRITEFPNSVQSTESDIATLVRQTGQGNPSKAAIGVPALCQCQHGFPQAFAMDPLPNNLGRINSGMLKLSCPYLVKAVDILEDEGMILRINEDNKENHNIDPMWEEMNQRHLVHSQVRQAMLSNKEIELLQSKLGRKGAASFLEAGVAGATQGSNDVKCLHAWLADALFLNNSSVDSVTTTRTTTTTTITNIGELIVTALGRLEPKVELQGTPDCYRFCNPNAPVGLADPPTPRNKQRLRTRKETERRKRQRTYKRSGEQGEETSMPQ